MLSSCFEPRDWIIVILYHQDVPVSLSKVSSWSKMLQFIGTRGRDDITPVLPFLHCHLVKS